MDELLIALLVWLGKSIAKAGRWLADRLAGRGPAPADGPHASGAQRQQRRPGAAGAQDEQAALAAWLGRLRDRLAQDGTQLEANPDLAALGGALNGPLRQRVDQTLRLLAGRSAEERGGPGPRAPADRLGRATAEAAWLERAHAEILQIAAERAGARGDALSGADRVAAGLAAALFEPLGWPPAGAARPGQPSVPTLVTRRGAEGAPDEGLPTLGLAVLPLPPSASVRPEAWAALARGLGRHLLAQAPGLRQEMHQRLGLPRRFRVPYLVDGTWGGEQVRKPFGCWLETLFGDAISVCLLGPAGAQALAQTLARPEAPAQTVTVGITAGWSEYTAEPPAYLRLLAGVTALETLGFAEPAEALLDGWWTAHGRPTALVVPTRMQGWVRAPMAAFEQQAMELASQLLAVGWASLGGTPLLERPGLGFGASEAADAEAIAAVLATSAHLPPSASPRPRVRLAGALLAVTQSPERAPDLARWIAEHGAEPPPEAGAYARGEDPYARRSGRDRPAAAEEASEESWTRPTAAMFRDALVLHEILGPPRALARRAIRS